MKREALACVPLMVRDQPIGALNVYRLGAGHRVRPATSSS